MKKYYVNFLLLMMLFFIIDTQGQITYSNVGSSGFPVLQFSSRAIVADFDNDKDGDILYQTGANSSSYRYARNNGNGSFTDMELSSSPFAGLTIPDNFGNNYYPGDYDADGDIDLWLGVTSGNGVYFRNDGASFSSQSTATFPTLAFGARAIVADFDGDKDVDILYQTGSNGSAYQFARNNGNATFNISALSNSPFAGLSLPDNSGSNYYLSDYDNDGDVDLWFGLNNTTGSYFRNDGATFSTQSSSSFPLLQFSSRAIVADYDSDGDGDILYQIGANGSSYEYAKNNGDGTFSKMEISASPFSGISLPDNSGNNYYFADYDNDNDLDVWFGGALNSGLYLRQNGTPPALLSSVPTDNATDVGRNQNIIVNFSEVVTVGNGNIRIFKSSDKSLVESIPATSSKVTGSNTSTIVIDPTDNFASNTSYYITFDAGAFKDADGATFGAYNHITNVIGDINDPAYLNFTTGVTILPVQLLSFTVTQQEGAAVIKWQTVNEVNADRFVIEYSIDGNYYAALSVIPVLKQTNSVNNYQYNHANTTEGTHYYRLVQYDKDGSKKVYQVKSLTITNLKSIVLYPNPVKDFVTIRFTPNNIKEIQVTDITGRILLRRKVIEGTGILTVNLQAITGTTMYIRALNANGSVTVLPIIRGVKN